MGFEQLESCQETAAAAEYMAHSCCWLVVVLVLVLCPSTALSGAAAVSQKGLGWSRWWWLLLLL